MFSFLRRRPSVRKLLPAGIDAHCHLLPGVDDGAPDMETALEIIRTQQALGLRGAICTPHIMARYPDNTPANLRRVFEQLVAAASTSSPNSTLSLSRRPVSACQREAGSKEGASPNAKTETFNLPCLGVLSRRINEKPEESGANAPTRSRKPSTFQLHLAAEYMLDEAFPRLLEHPDRLLTIPSYLITPASASSPNSTLSTFNLQLSTSAAGNQDFILIELPQYLLPEGWLDVLDSIRACGLRPLLAHPERYLRLLSESDLADLYTRGLRYQGNLGSLAGIYGPQVQRLARRLHKANLYTTWGTDAHSSTMITKMELAA